MPVYIAPTQKMSNVLSTNFKTNVKLVRWLAKG